VTSPVDVLVIGAGPAGTSCAALLAREGLEVTLVDRATFPRHKACAEYLSPEAARDLDDLGVLGEVEAAAPARLTGFRLVSDDGTEAVGHYDRTPFPPYRPFGYALPRSTLDLILLEAASRTGARVRTGVALERLIVEHGVVRGAVLREADARTEVRARVTIGADGLNSAVARQLGLARRGRLRRLALVAHLAGVSGTGDVGEMFTQRGWYVGLAPIGGGLVNVAMVVEMSSARAILEDREGFFLGRLAGIPELRERIAYARIARGILVAGPFARRARRATADGALLVGDAADFYDPFTGEGIFAALRGGRLASRAVVRALASGSASRLALAPYESERRASFLGKWALERIAAHGATRPAVMRRFTRALARRRALADLWVGAAGDTVPVRTLFTPRHLAALIV
jgi:geranylgeranyl reductase family protein